jgi:hypothetical protein
VLQIYGEVTAWLQLRHPDAQEILIVGNVAIVRLTWTLTTQVNHQLDRYRETAKMMLEPWLLETALARLRNRRLDIEFHTQVATREALIRVCALSVIVATQVARWKCPATAMF